ncbi:hypothetical protein H5410_018315 [Solanum commersonii]|uniref:Uncharacterized protein n=1 Tax=Solanum commersonii TaxID=4109 RepID=A0A9J6A2H8_SOLCO|nr:hypothetical protein H5410_018315 [Solanum commersonii]
MAASEGIHCGKHAQSKKKVHDNCYRQCPSQQILLSGKFLSLIDISTIIAADCEEFAQAFLQFFMELLTSTNWAMHL